MIDNAIGRTVIDVAVRIHRDLGPGLLERVYELVMADELTREGLVVERQKPIAIAYRGREFAEGFRADLLIENKVLIEVKCVETLHKAHKKQLLTYLKLTGLKLGYLLNFGAPLIKQGIVRTVNELA